jgi:hypothetical protein
VLYYPKSYPKLKPPIFPAHPFALRYARDAWTHSLLWHPAVLLVLVPLALIGGALLGLAVLVRLSNGLIAATVVALLLITHVRGRALAVSLGGLAFAPAVALYYPKSYPKLKPPVFPAHPFALRYARDAWTHSLLWHPAVLVVLVPLALFGLATVRSRGAAVLAISIGVTAAFYSFYQLTPIHPRFLFVVLPMLFILWAAGAAAVTARVRGLYDRAR